MNFDSLAVLQALPDALLVCDADGVVQFVNPAAERLLHVRAEELVGGRELPYWDASELREGHFVKWANQSARVFVIQITPFDFGEHDGLIVRYDDKTSSRHQYLTIHYEMRQRITIVTSCLDLLYHGYLGNLNEEQLEDLGMVRKFVRSLSDYMWIVSGWMRQESLPFEFRWYNESFNKIIRAWLNNFTVIPTDEDYYIRYDESSLWLVFTTINFLGSQSEQKSLDVTVVEDTSLIHMKINIKNVPFFYDSKYGLSGLCQRIIETHGGTFNYTKHADTASTFTITLPIAEPEQ